MVAEVLQYHWQYNGDSNGISLRIWDAVNGELLQTVSEHSNDVHNAAYSPDGKWVATASEDQTVRVYKVNQPAPNPANL